MSWLPAHVAAGTVLHSDQCCAYNSVSALSNVVESIAAQGDVIML